MLQADEVRKHDRFHEILDSILQLQGVKNTVRRQKLLSDPTQVSLFCPQCDSLLQSRRNTTTHKVIQTTEDINTATIFVYIIVF